MRRHDIISIISFVLFDLFLCLRLHNASTIVEECPHATATISALTLSTHINVLRKEKERTRGREREMLRKEKERTRGREREMDVKEE